MLMRPKLLLLFFAPLDAVWGQPRPPVILIDGHHLICKPENLTSLHDFGELQQRLQSESVQVSFFTTCSFSGKPSIEEMANTLGATIRNQSVPEVDLVSHSMGGLIVRAYLSGKQNGSGVFTPPRIHTCESGSRSQHRISERCCRASYRALYRIDNRRSWCRVINSCSILRPGTKIKTICEVSMRSESSGTREDLGRSMAKTTAR
jgi:hypothetical protein